MHLYHWYVPNNRLVVPERRTADAISLYLDNDPSKYDSIMVRLLDACIQGLRQRGMGRMYIDAKKGGDAGFQSMGMRLMSFSWPSSFVTHLLTIPQASMSGPDTERFGGMHSLHSHFAPLCCELVELGSI